MPATQHDVLTAMREARRATVRAGAQHHAALHRSFLLRAEREPDTAIAWEVAAEEQRLLAEELRGQLRALGGSAATGAAPAGPRRPVLR